ncbi:hypothetical protein [Streptomyces sp. NPDC090112]|uniref:hypothetical protein n=1 Tax=Streptomyces sp. NPDC090112 TaxID=3365949 RepID=UPI003819F078
MTSMEKRCEEPRKGLAGMPYASIVPDRNPALKYHVGLGRAKAAVAWELPNRYNYETRQFEYRGVRGGEVYKRTGDTWELLHRVESGTRFDELPWKDGR